MLELSNKTWVKDDDRKSCDIMAWRRHENLVKLFEEIIKEVS